MTHDTAAHALPAAYRAWRASTLGQITDRIEEDLLRELLGPAAGQQVLDAGCGDGALAVQLAHAGACVTGLDADAPMLAAARARSTRAAVDLRLVHGDVESAPFAAGSFDGIVAVAVLCFIRDADATIAQLARLLRPGGRLVIGELGRWNLWAAGRRLQGWRGAPIWRAARFRTRRELCALMRRHGLAIEAVRGAVFYPPLGMAARLLAPLDPWLGRRTTAGAAFIAVRARRLDLDAEGG